MKLKMILTNAFDIDVRVYKEAKYLVKKGHEVEILCWDKTPEKGLPEYEILDDIKIKRFGISSKSGSGVKQLNAYRLFIISCKRYLKHQAFDFLHCHDLDGAISGFFIGGKYVFDMHEFYDKGNVLKKKFSHFATVFLAKRAEANIYVANISLETYGKYIQEKFYLLKNYCDADMFVNTTKSKSNYLRVSYIGSVRGQITEFVALFEAVKDIDNVVVNIYGDGVDLPILNEVGKEYNNVIIHGGYNGVEESSIIYKNTDISFLGYNPNNPNYQNDFEPVKLYEAIFTLTPIIATKTLNPGKIASSKGIGIAVDTRDSQQIKNAILFFKNNQNFYDKCVKNMKTIASNYDWKEAVTVLDKIYG